MFHFVSTEAALFSNISDVYKDVYNLIVISVKKICTPPQEVWDNLL